MSSEVLEMAITDQVECRAAAHGDLGALDVIREVIRRRIRSQRVACARFVNS